MTDDRTSRETVLVVDDSPDTLSFLTDALEEAGATVLVAMDGPGALSLLERLTPDVVLMDAVMPGMDGFETCRRLKASKTLAHVPVIFMTGLSETEHIVRGFAAGGVDYLTKPIIAEELFARMRVHLVNARIAQGAQAALDATGRFLLSVDLDGRILWCTPQAGRLLGDPGGPEEAGFRLPPALLDWLVKRVEGPAGAVPERMSLPSPAGGPPFQVGVVSRIGPQEVLLRLVEGQPSGEEQAIRQRLNLTAREAEVLLWIARGKANRDIGQILGLSPRTVNKHLEQIYAKLGVENRTAAAALALRTLEGG